MNKIPLIIKREYLTRVKKKSFIIMTIVGPILMAALFVAPVWIATKDDNSIKIVEVYDKTEFYKNAFTNSETLSFKFINEENDSIRKSNFLLSGNYALLTILDTSGNEFSLYSENSPDMILKEQISGKLQRFIEEQNYKRLGIKKENIESAKADVSINTYKITEEGEEESSAELTLAIGFIASIIIYMFIFMYGVQVMRGVIEEKVNRVVEVLISSVKPFQLMAGKIIGVAMVALTQFLLWAVLTGIIVSFIMILFGSSFIPAGMDVSQLRDLSSDQLTGVFSNNMSSKLLIGLLNFHWLKMLATFIFYFIGGYLLYSSLFAAIGAAVDNETDTQQFTLPVTIPLIIAFIAAQGVIKDPEGPLAFWLSVIPFTSPVIMPVRIALYRFEWWEILISVGALVLTFLATVWLAAKIYRTGILMYGKKISYKELWKWLRYK